MLAARVPVAMAVDKPRGAKPPSATSDAAQRASVAKDYADVANQSGGCCVSSTPNRSAIGYTDADRAVAGDADLGVGCGTPVRLAALRKGETVLDLGCGAGVDCFLAHEAVGARGFVVGVDMTPAMLAKARAGAEARGLRSDQLEFRLGDREPPRGRRHVRCRREQLRREPVPGQAARVSRGAPGVEARRSFGGGGRGADANVT